MKNGEYELITGITQDKIYKLGECVCIIEQINGSHIMADVYESEFSKSCFRNELNLAKANNDHKLHNSLMEAWRAIEDYDFSKHGRLASHTECCNYEDGYFDMKYQLTGEDYRARG